MSGVRIDSYIKVDLIIPFVTLWNPGTVALNNAIPRWVQSHSTEASPIYIADCSTGFPLSGLRDGVHPNDEGDAIIASRVFPVLLNVIQSALEERKHAYLGEQEPLL